MNRIVEAGVVPRVFNLHQMAVYLGCSYWTARDYVLQGLIPVIHMPALKPRVGDRQKPTLRRILIDKQDLDVFIEARKGHAVDVTSSAPQVTTTQSRGYKKAVPVMCPSEGQVNP